MWARYSHSVDIPNRSHVVSVGQLAEAQHWNTVRPHEVCLVPIVQDFGRLLLRCPRGVTADKPRRQIVFSDVFRMNIEEVDRGFTWLRIADSCIHLVFLLFNG